VIFSNILCMKTTENTENTEENFDLLSYSVIGAAIEVHRHLGSGLLESTYERCLALELKLQGVSFQTQVAMPIVYKGTELDLGYRIDMLVENSLIVELKAVDRVMEIHQAQILTYMKLANIPVGLIINFNSAPLRSGIQRLAL
jgi:GxxExxY protein